jgi:alkylation response protein AidB-like acyl-CoA dehydrogenase
MHAMSQASLVQDDSTLELIADVAASFAVRDAPRVRDLRDAGGQIDRAMWRRLAENGWLGALVPEELGGAGLSIDAVAIVARRLGFGAFPEPFVAAGVLAPLLLAAAHANGDRLASVLAGEQIVGVGWQSDGARIAHDGSLHGDSRFLGIGAADAYIVAAQHAGAIGLYWVVADAPGLTVTLEQCADGTRSAALGFDGVQADTLVAAGAAQAPLAAALDTARIALAAELCGVMDATLELTLDYLCQRKQFGVRIGSFQALQHRAVDAWIQRELADAALDAAIAVHLDPGSDARARAAAASSAKARAGVATQAIARAAVQLHGAIGYTDEYDLGLYVNRALTLAPWLGNAAEHTRRFAELAGAVDDAAAHEDEHEHEHGARANPAGPNDLNSLSDAGFRSLVRADIEAHYPPGLRYAPRRLFWNEQQEWIDHLLERGWIAPGWPVELGGLGLSPLKQIIFWEEHERWGATLYREHGVVQVGPMLMKHGTPAQQDRWLPPILRAEHHWAQGYSEPEAGSDLASLRTRAVRDGDHYLINGQKIWTTLAQAATHIYFLARTDPDAKKQKGISFLLAELTTPGITVRPIRDIAGHEELCEVFFDDVRVPVENRVGAENEGWTIAKSLLGHERITIGSPAAPEYGLQVLASVARAAGVLEEPSFKDRYGALSRDVAHLRDAYARYKQMLARGEEIGPDVSMLKIVSTESFQAIAEAIIDTAGDAGGFVGADVRLGNGAVDVLTAFYRACPMTIYGGSNEIQRNIIATAVLGLPRG